MALRAKKPQKENTRFRALIYGAESSGKSHFACSIPNSYYIDTEGLQKYKKFYEMLNENGSVIVKLHNMTDIIDEIKDLIETKHNYTTIVIDSISVPYNFLANLEVERLKEVSSKKIEGTEFSAHLNKSKRLLFHIAMLLERVDMNVIVISHEKSKFENNTEVGKIYDVNDKIAHALGCVIHMQKRGNQRFGYIQKSRFDEIKENESIEFNDAHKVLVEKFGDSIFSRKIKNEKLASSNQLKELRHLINVLNISDDGCQKILTSSKCGSFEELDENQINKFIEFFKNKLILKGE